MREFHVMEFNGAQRKMVAKFKTMREAKDYVKASGVRVGMIDTVRDDNRWETLTYTVIRRKPKEAKC